VAMHAIGNLDWSANHQLYRFLLEIFQGATLVFVMISGYLFQHLSNKFNYYNYLTTKFKNVILPYIIISLPGVMLLLTKSEFLAENPELQGSPLWARVIFLYIYGGAQLNYVLWFVPVMTIYYLLAPIFIKFLRNPALFLSLIVLIPSAILAHRTTVQKYHHFQLAFYFLPAYMTGMLAGLYREKVRDFTDHYIIILLIAFLCVLFGHFFLTDYDGSYVQEIFSTENGVIDWIFVQKFLLFFILLYIFRRLDRFNLSALDYIATVSFAIFFLHIYVLYVYSHIIHWHQYAGNLQNLVLLLIMTISCSTFLAYLSRRFFGRTSRMLIGA
jgi:peptidoglycan/LPS O-acetylase OafA/YrhL